MIETFYRDLEEGKKVEEIVLTEIVHPKYPDAYIVDGYCKDWDIYIPSEDKGIEVKSDKKSQETGNIVVEIAFNGKLSALMTTKSYRWIFYTGTSFIITTPYRILKTIANNKLYPVEFTGKGDRHSKLAYLIKQTMLEDTALKVQS